METIELKIKTFQSILDDQIKFWENAITEAEKDKDLRLHVYFCKGCLQEAKHLKETYIGLMKCK